MKRDEIEAKWETLEPRERDAWVAEVVFGKKIGRERRVGGVVYEVGYGNVGIALDEYTTDISAAWTVFEQFPYIEIARIPREHATYAARINSNDGEVRAITQEATLPAAVCLAAIIAKLTS